MYHKGAFPMYSFSLAEVLLLGIQPLSPSSNSRRQLHPDVAPIPAAQYFS